MPEDESTPEPAPMREMLEVMHPVDLADFFLDVDLEERVRMIELLEPERAAHVLAALPHADRVALVDAMGEARLAPIVEKMPAEAVADIIDHLPVQKETRILLKIEKEHAEDIQDLRKHEDHTAGGRMTKNFVAVPDTFTAGETIKAIQGAVDSHTVDFVYVVDDASRLQGVVSLPKLMIHGPDEPVAGFMRRDITFVGATMDQEEVARIAQRYKLRAVPVLDNTMKLIGVVTLNDILAVMQHEASEDMMKMAGAEHTHPINAPFLERLKARAPWLGAAMILELVIAWIMKAYGGTLEKMALAYFIPVIMAMGGSVGLQSATMVVRGLATGELTLGKGFRVVMAEMRVGLMIGLVAGLITGLMATLMQIRSGEALQLGLIVFVSMGVSICIAATLGAFTPLALQKMKFDPAVASGPFITAINDVVNVTIYLTLATLLIVKTA